MDFLFDQDHREWTTLTRVSPAQRKTWSSSMLIAAAAHLVVLAVICWPAVPIFVKPQLIAHGQSGNATPAGITLYLPDDIRLRTADKPALLPLPATPHKKPQKSWVKKRTNTLEAEKPSNTLEAGSELGSGDDGPASGDEIKPALPVTFQDLRISRAELPGGVQGDVIVEITIDAQGIVVEEKLLQGLGHGVDERVIAILRDWRFRPATRNGMPIPSKHDVHFHFPS